MENKKEMELRKLFYLVEKKKKVCYPKWRHKQLLFLHLNIGRFGRGGEGGGKERLDTSQCHPSSPKEGQISWLFSTFVPFQCHEVMESDYPYGFKQIKSIRLRHPWCSGFAFLVRFSKAVYPAGLKSLTITVTISHKKS